MTPHVRSRLSAYLDGELPVAERGAVDQHLRVCAACARRLEDLAALDEAARALPVAAPAGYFEQLPARVRARLTPKPSDAWRPPAWSWAVAAALLLAIVTPATLLRRDATFPEAAGHGAPVEPARPSPEAIPSHAATRDDKLEASKRLGYLEGAPSVAPLQERASSAPAAPPPTVAGAAPAPGSVEGRLRKQEPQPRATTRPRDNGPAVAVFAQPAEPLADARAVPSKDDADRQAAAEEDLARPKATAPGARRREAVMVPAPALSAGRASSAEACSAGLLARGVPVSLAEARVLREGWRACLRDFPAAPGADAARVRMIEAGVDVYRRSGDEKDLEQVRADAAEYLARADAGQPERVRALLVELGEEP